MIKKNIQNNGGFTLIELLVSIALFSVVLVMALGAILTIVDLNRKTQAMSSVTNNVNFAVESMVRIIKSAESISASGGAGCEVGSDTPQISLDYIDTYGIFPDIPGISTKGVHYRHNCSDNTIERQITNDGISPNSNDWVSITSIDDLDIVRVDFNVTTDDQQKVKLLIEGIANVGSETSDFIIQTTATRRQY